MMMRLILLLCVGLCSACSGPAPARAIFERCRALYVKDDQPEMAVLAAAAVQGYRSPHMPSLHAILLPHKASLPRKVKQCDDLLILQHRLPP